MVQELDLERLDERELNQRLQALVGSAEQVVLRNTHARHNIAVNIHGALDVVVQGSAGFYCCGFMNGPNVLVTGNVGWYAADNMLGGKLIVQNNAGSNLAPSMIGGTVLVRGSAGSRVGYGLKGGTVIVCGSVGMLTGQQMLGGRIVLLNAVGTNTGESMYGGVIFFRRGALAGAGSNVRVRAPEQTDLEALEWLFAENNIRADPREFECLVPRTGKQSFHIFKPQFEKREQVSEHL
ncbi:MAG: glutamate synthase [Chloroflexi bacterium]|nr:glutamate synthase [Chloroflexota bacterium]